MISPSSGYLASTSIVSLYNDTKPLKTMRAVNKCWFPDAEHQRPSKTVQQRWSSRGNLEFLDPDVARHNIMCFVYFGKQGHQFLTITYLNGSAILPWAHIKQARYHHWRYEGRVVHRHGRTVRKKGWVARAWAWPMHNSIHNLHFIKNAGMKVVWSSIASLLRQDGATACMDLLETLLAYLGPVSDHNLTNNRKFHTARRPHIPKMQTITHLGSRFARLACHALPGSVCMPSPKSTALCHRSCMPNLHAKVAKYLYEPWHCICRQVH